MRRLINIDELPNFEVLCSDGKKYVLLPFEHLTDIPTVDATTVVHGKWTTTDTLLGRCCVCSVCGSCPTMEYKYCPYCGAKMDGE